MPFFEDRGNSFSMQYGDPKTAGNIAGMHIHPQYEALLVPAYCDQNSLVYGNELPVLSSPSLCVFAPYVMHRVHLSGGDSTEHYVFYFGEDFLKDTAPLFPLFSKIKDNFVSRFLIPPEQLERISPFLTAAKRFWNRKSVAIPNVLCIMNYLLEVGTEEHIEKPVGKDKNYQEIIHFIVKNCGESLTADFVADTFYISRSKLDQDLNRKFNISFHKLLSDVRLNKAKLLLTQTDTSISSIAESVGFEQETNFFAFFKRNTGYTPAEFRKRIQFR